MNRAHFRPLPLAVALAAFALNLVFAGRRARPAPCETGTAAVAAATPREAAAQIATTPPQAHARTAAPAAEPTPAGITRLAQREIVRMPDIGNVLVSAYENDDETRLVLTEYDGPKRLASVTMAGGSLNPKLRFAVLHVKGLPDPTVVAVSVSPGGSGSTYEMVAVAPSGGEVRELTRTDSFTTSEGGGFYLGDLGRGNGLGLAVWNFVWDYDGGEARATPHQYEVKLYKWNKGSGRFEWRRVLRTAGKFDGDDAALRSLGLRFRDVREGVQGLAEVY